MRKGAKSIDFTGFEATYVQHTFVTLRTRLKMLLPHFVIGICCSRIFQ
jgi:hypothetical protein